MWNNECGMDGLFSDIEELATQCKFSDCSHNSELGCAIRMAISDGLIDEERFGSYKKLKAENEYTENQDSYLQEKREKFRQISKFIKASKKRGIEYHAYT